MQLEEGRRTCALQHRIRLPEIDDMMELEGAANDIRTVSGVCTYVGRVNQNNLESRSTSASIVLAARISEPSVRQQHGLQLRSLRIVRLRRTTFWPKLRV